MKLGKVGTIGRFKPLHNGAYLMLRTLCENAEEVRIGIGSANKYNLRNPFTADESEAIIREALQDEFSNFKVYKIPDFAHIAEYADGKKWRQNVREIFGELDLFVTANPYVNQLLREEYKILHPAELIPREKMIRLRATEIRVAIARYDDWQNFVPEKVVSYLEKNGIVDRFREEFGLATLSDLAFDNPGGEEDEIVEQFHAQET